MVNSLNRIGLASNCSSENRKLAIDLAQLIITWELQRIATAKVAKAARAIAAATAPAATSPAAAPVEAGVKRRAESPVGGEAAGAATGAPASKMQRTGIDQKIEIEQTTGMDESAPDGSAVAAATPTAAKLEPHSSGPPSPLAPAEATPMDESSAQQTSEAGPAASPAATTPASPARTGAASAAVGPEGKPAESKAAESKSAESRAAAQDEESRPSAAIVEVSTGGVKGGGLGRALGGLGVGTRGLPLPGCACVY